ncbi:hypothetical protein [Lactobacillus sp. ESL0677]|uniref:hypothetical protein n=1 Tax=Lactobacillus sp. ESL0677 TaxID=2983208 RepID=UPI0023F9BF5D|nr:hypothetical protein [Lactobacillus sp. ESL0677]WEV36846.1 hypothetical protein OZX76_08925 [Lactobacillus sp. ESL0677]
MLKREVKSTRKKGKFSERDKILKIFITKEEIIEHVNSDGTTKRNIAWCSKWQERSSVFSLCISFLSLILSNVLLNIPFSNSRDQKIKLTIKKDIAKGIIYNNKLQIDTTFLLSAICIIGVLYGIVIGMIWFFSHAKYELTLNSDIQLHLTRSLFLPIISFIIMIAYAIISIRVIRKPTTNYIGVIIASFLFLPLIVIVPFSNICCYLSYKMHINNMPVFIRIFWFVLLIITISCFIISQFYKNFLAEMFFIIIGMIGIFIEIFIYDYYCDDMKNII